jgi:hypothetical protein
VDSSSGHTSNDEAKSRLQSSGQFEWQFSAFVSGSSKVEVFSLSNSGFSPSLPLSPGGVFDLWLN